MFGHSNAPTRTVSAEVEDDGPTFPLFLLPSFGFSFRRQRRRASSSAQSSSSQPRRISNADTDSEYYDSLSSVPSLSSSPESASDFSPSSPKGFKSFFPELPSLNQLHLLSSDKSEKKPVSLPSDGPRLSRMRPDTLRCNTCSTDIAFCSQIVSKGFTGRHGRAYLVSAPSAKATTSCPASPLNKKNNPKSTKAGTDADLVNIHVGRPENRQLVTGQHVVADISCIVCGSKLGWKYVDAREQAQKYKVGKFILETQRVVAFHSWEDIDEEDDTTASRNASTGNIPQHVAAQEEAIVFDSEDEDECDEIFAGVWDAEVVAKRRRHKVSNIRRNGGSTAVVAAAGGP
ncbi:yippee-like protein [Rhypophila decipiens]|uniref:Yippee-like protein n=1 Tax=Rhypophila decipiens TaxID=261697 RepID=A0AAN6Y8Z9_9PEZI|nr:yippee-like protein [Rhypophila decipiens]